MGGRSVIDADRRVERKERSSPFVFLLVRRRKNGREWESGPRRQGKVTNPSS